MQTDSASLPSRMWRRYIDAVRSGAGGAMLLATLLLSGWTWLEHDITRALIAGSLLYLFLTISLALGRNRKRY